MSDSRHPRGHRHVWQLVATQRAGGLAFGKPKAWVYACTIGDCRAQRTVKIRRVR